MSLVVLFDGGCPLCSREIAHYRKLEAVEPIRWVDVTQSPGELQGFGLSLPAALATFHVIDTRTGASHLGALAFLRLWRSFPRYRWISNLVMRLRLTPVLVWGYRAFAKWHFRRRCRAGACDA